MQIVETLRYTPEHAWVQLLDDGSWAVGITYHAQGELGDIVFLELPEVGRQLGAGEACAVVESVKTASEIYAPAAGTVLAVNTALTKTPERVNAQPYEAWLFKLQPGQASDIATLLSAQAYCQSIGLDYAP